MGAAYGKPLPPYNPSINLFTHDSCVIHAGPFRVKVSTRHPGGSGRSR